MHTNGKEVVTGGSKKAYKPEDALGESLRALKAELKTITASFNEAVERKREEQMLY